MFSFTKLNPLGLLGPKGDEAAESASSGDYTTSTSFCEPSEDDFEGIEKVFSQKTSRMPGRTEADGAIRGRKSAKRKKPAARKQKVRRMPNAHSPARVHPSEDNKAVRKSGRIEVKSAIRRRNDAQREKAFENTEIYGLDTGILPSD
ncbi:hypothetical protein TrRE_jg5070 [Triparma retinervis]|jgi:hypothetical protein|uniref:Uncharacterized protein n=1 Tax=Triparma retinervis TaxID=2557542 RepID=A0A9W7E1V1_9STRA|nr:hypothetical protein TrRE_jg5070 [Triparma retinervis]